MSSLKELENFSSLKHPIFKGLWIFSKPKEPSWSLSRLFEARIWASIQSLCIPGSIKRFVPPGRGNGPDLGWLKETRKEVRYAWVEERNRTGTHGERKGLSSEKEDKTAALGIHVRSCINAPFGTQFPFWKDKKGENQVEKWLTFLLRYKFAVLINEFLTVEDTPPPHPPTTTSTYFPWSLSAPSEAANPESDGMGTHRECCHSTLHFSGFLHHSCGGACLGHSGTLISVWFQRLQQQFVQSVCEIASRGSDGATALGGDCLPFQRVCLVSGVIQHTTTCKRNQTLWIAIASLNCTSCFYFFLFRIKHAH